MKFIKNYWFPLVIGFIVIMIIILFCDFSFLFKINGNRNKNIYKIYQLYDRNSSPVTYEYKTLELNKNLSEEKVIKEIIKKTKNNLPKDTKVIDFKIKKNVLILNLNQKFIDNYPMDEDLFLLNVNSIVNTFTYLENINGVVFKVENKPILIDNIAIDFSKTFVNNIENFIVYSPLKNKLSTFLYNDTNYSLYYTDSNYKELKIKKIKELKNLTTIISAEQKNNQGDYKTSEEQWIVKNEGLYLNGSLLLEKDYKVDSKYKISNYKAFINNKKYKADCLVKKIYEDDDKSVIIILEITINKLSENEMKYVEDIYLKQGYGIIRHEISDGVNNYQYYYKLSKRVFAGEK